MDEPDCTRLGARGWLLAAVLKHKEAPSGLGKLKERLHMGRSDAGRVLRKLRGSRLKLKLKLPLRGRDGRMVSEGL